MTSRPQLNVNRKEGSRSEQVRKKRNSSYWEPIYDPQFTGTTNEFDWSTTQKTGVKKSLCKSSSLKSKKDSLNVRGWTIKSFNFVECDFSGSFHPTLSFNSCVFEKCDMGFTTWRGTKFSNCTFIKCSFTMATFEQCIFHNCTWEDTGMSGTETKLFDTIIENPKSFIDSGYTNIDQHILKQNGNTTPEYQLLRLEETKVKLARLVLSNNERNSEDSVYYESIQVYLTQSIKAKSAKALFNIKSKKNLITSFFSLIFSEFEKGLISISGSINGWGGNISRATLFGVLIILIYSIIYTFVNFDGFEPSPWKLAIIKSLDISLLIGYTKHATVALNWKVQTLYGINALLGLWWYAIFVPTVINRICRVR
ncbi:pentapeptide repeat-containing protein [Aeromonas caviae]|uniref:anti-phage Hailong system effector protein HalA n=1 Tax=Aeromonas caviae TaxID=648 RepID=UPI0038D200E4